MLESLRSTDGLELVREVAQRLLQELIEAEATARIGAEWGEQAETRTAYRNGHREKTVTTQAGDLELAIPKLRAGSFFPSLLERRRRIDQALYAVIMEAYVHGVSTRSVDDLVKALGSDTGISKSEVSRICAGLDEELDVFRARPLDPGLLQSLLVLDRCWSGEAEEFEGSSETVVGHLAEAGRDVRVAR
ncbi:transposase, partial [Streptomyces sp. H27-H1]